MDYRYIFKREDNSKDVRWLIVGNKAMGWIRVVVLKITSIKFSIELISVPP
jgi:hypothetical protein